MVSVSPSSRSLPNRTFSKNSWPVRELWIPILRKGFDCVKPSIPLSSTKVSTLRSRGSTESFPAPSFSFA
ncbi:Uncharacterised protein [Mycobacteroides abscessus subsp. abscessus]|nr:Uncharacterised protein [Mycobacteroides abscessus subsp. abscessus]SKV63830.1 Uncharacterised protein [Mycobacteroides abscessus subsp. abscessus]